MPALGWKSRRTLHERSWRRAGSRSIIKLQTRVPRDYLEKGRGPVAEATFRIHSMQTSLFLLSVFVPAISCFRRVVRVNTDPGLSGRNETGVKTLLSQEWVDLLDSCPCLGLGMSDCVLPQLTLHLPNIGVVH